MSVYKKLQEARIKLQGMDLKKTGHNKFSGYYYFELGDFLPQTQTIFAELGLCGVVSFNADLASLTIIDVDDATQHTITSPMGTAALKGMHEIQNIGAVETYQRRYLWVTAMEIVEHDAIDSTEKLEGKAVKPAEKLSDSSMDDVKLAMLECTTLDQLQNVFGPAYKKAGKPQQADLKKAYDKFKQQITEGVAA